MPPIHCCKLHRFRVRHALDQAAYRWWGLILGLIVLYARTAFACVTNNDCPVGRHCVAGDCRMETQPGCSTNAGCPAGKLCIAGRCTAVVSPAGCVTDSDCPAGKTCSLGRCVFRPSFECTKEQDCPRGQTCVKRSCISCDTLCPVAAPPQCRGSTLWKCSVTDHGCVGYRVDTVCPQDCCNGECVNLASNRNNCGVCGHACPSLTSCKSGTCKCDNECNGVCKDINTDAENCGKCGVVCPAGATCQAKVCTSPAPKITAVAPTIQMRSGSITITGTNFESTCSKNSVTLAGVTAAPTTCSKSSLTLTVPGSASYGPTQVVVTVAQKASNSYGFTVAREFGSFVEITNDVAGNTSPRSCPNGGAVRLDICKPTCPGYPEGQAAALFLRQSTNKLIGSPYGFRFHAPTVKGLGGAGFSRCSVGLVLNADIEGSGIKHLMALHFLDLDTGKSFQGSPLCFDWWTGTPDHAYSPRILRSPDGTILMLVSAAPAPENIAATLLDKVKGGKLLTRICSKGLAEPVQATITSKNEITLDIGGSTHVDGIKID